MFVFVLIDSCHILRARLVFTTFANKLSLHICSGGLQFKAEIACTTPGSNYNCPYDYRTAGDNPNQFYYGRGYLQLSWSYNYGPASSYLFGDSSVLLNNPGLVASDDATAWNTAFWFWRTNVHSAALSGNFGATTNVINGGLECSPCRNACSTRYGYYLKALTAFGLPTSGASNAGC